MKISRPVQIAGAIGIFVLVISALIGIFNLQNEQEKRLEAISGYELSDLTSAAEELDVSKLNIHKIQPKSALSGNLSENIEGDPNKAKVIIFEYADYQCSACASKNAAVNEIIEAYDGKVAVVFRTYLLAYHDKAVMAAAAANAAAIQGYWREMKDLLFADQDDWYYMSSTKFQAKVEEYFMNASSNKGNLEQFREDMKSPDVLQKIAFDYALGEKADLSGTPMFYIDGKLVSFANLRDTIDSKL